MRRSGFTDIVRGEDLFAATHVPRALLQALLGPARAALPPPCLAYRRGRQNGWPRGTAPLPFPALREAGEDGRGWRRPLRRGELPIGFAAAKA
ncbi:hypothetical protein DdX_21951 [Ditylenchus destructor]|uniref:Uncharacterized protein n=1 Tax=Ditylenchus destructor TaxID=166010 RepID=A0AAD4MEY1_9BILA|nr:hypothetical protein DdX_21951 [Ditylenchus destructor]